jgi:hypothetical protein
LQAEVRPELWGRYAAALNKLQGCLAAIAPQQQQQQQQQQQHQQQQQQQQQQPWPQGCVVLSAAECEVLRRLVLLLLQQLEVAVNQRKAPTGD